MTIDTDSGFTAEQLAALRPTIPAWLNTEIVPTESAQVFEKAWDTLLELAERVYDQAFFLTPKIEAYEAVACSLSAPGVVRDAIDAATGFDRLYTLLMSLGQFVTQFNEETDKAGTLAAFRAFLDGDIRTVDEGRCDQ
jgi:hypothetical protein